MKALKLLLLLSGSDNAWILRRVVKVLMTHLQTYAHKTETEIDDIVLQIIQDIVDQEVTEE